MEMEVAIPVPAVDFNFDSACSSPYISAPSSPKPFGDFYFSAPTSPTRASAIYREFNNLAFIHDGSSISGRRAYSSSTIPFDWEEKPGTPKSRDQHTDEDDFEFDFSGQLEKPPLSAADELFDGGKIRPLKPPPRLQLGDGPANSATRKSPVSSPRSPRSHISQGKKMFRDAFSPRHKKDFDPFAAAMEQTRKEAESGRGRRRVSDSSGPNSGRRGSRSLSPFRVSEFAWEESQQQQNHNNTKPSSSSNSSSKDSSSTPTLKGYRKWRWTDFLLFRSASEGRAQDKDPLNKYAAWSRKNDEDAKSSSFRSTDSGGGSVGASRRRSSDKSGSAGGSSRRGQVSAHELHYTTKRAVSEELKKKTFLPYKQGLLGCLGFSPTLSGLSKGIGSIGSFRG